MLTNSWDTLVRGTGAGAGQGTYPGTQFGGGRLSCNAISGCVLTIYHLCDTCVYDTMETLIYLINVLIYVGT